MEAAVHIRKSEPSPLWEHFTKYSEGGKCNYCGKLLKSHNSTSNLMNHLRSQHRDKWDLLKHLYPRHNNAIKKEKRSRGEMKLEEDAKCTGLDHITGEIIEYESDTVIMSPSECSLRKRNRRADKSPVWKHFTRYSLGGKCNHCGLLLKSYSSTSNLMNHLRNMHPDQWETMKHLYPSKIDSNKLRCPRTKQSIDSMKQDPFEVDQDNGEFSSPPPKTSMKPKSSKSPVWRYFKKINDSGLCKCNICGKVLKSINSTSSLLNHLRRHPKNWAKIQSEYAKRYKSDTTEDKTEFSDDQMEYVDMGGEETVDEGEVILYEPEQTMSTPCPTPETVRPKKRVKDHQIESLVRFVVRGEMPMAITEQSEFRQLLQTQNPDIDFYSEIQLRNIMNDKYNDVVATIKEHLVDAKAISLGICEWIDALSGRNFIGITCHYIQISELKSALIILEELNEGMSEDQLYQKFASICDLWHLQKGQVDAFTVSGGNPLITKIFSKLFGGDRLVYCFAHALSMIAKKPFETMEEVHSIMDAIKQITDYMKMGNEILVEDYEEGQQFWDMIYTTPTTWKGLLQQMDSFVKFSDKIEAIFLDQPNAPPTLPEDVIHEIRDLLKVFRPLICVIEELSLDDHLLTSKVIPIVQCLLASFEDTWPETNLGIETKQMIMAQINTQFAEMEENEIFSLSTLIDPRFKKNYFKKPHVRDMAIAKLKEIVAVSNDPFECETVTEVEGSIWKFHMSFVESQATIAPHPITLYLSSKLSPLLDTDPIQYFSTRHTELRSGAEKLLIPMATCASPKKIFSESGNTIHHNWSSLPIHDLRRLMLLKSVLNG